MVEGVHDYAIFMLDPDGRVATWNVGAERFKGYKAVEIIGQHFSRFYTEEDIAIRHPWTELEIAAREGNYEEEGWRVRKDGSRFYASVVITALRDEGGELHGFAKVTRDITERRQREQEHAAAQVLEQQRRFLKDVLVSVTQGKLVLCDQPGELPVPLGPDPIGDPIPLSRTALKKVRTRVREVAESCGLPQPRAQDLITAASECAMNSVQHAGGGTAWVFGDSEEGVVQVWIEDAGKGIDLSNLPRATLEVGFSTGGVGIGHGFSLMIACCQRIYLLTGASGTTVVLEQTREVPEPTWFQTIRTEWDE
jgi:PAS domain S-box-containing protein